MEPDKVVIAEILRPRGNRGELLAKPQTDIPGRMESLKVGNVRLADGSDASVEIAGAWPYRDHWVLKFSGVDSITAAERFRGADLWVPLEERGRLPEGEFFESDLTGCTVLDRLTGKPLGVVEGWQRYGGPPLMELTVDGHDVLIPFVPSLHQRVDLEKRTIEVELPEGLLDL